MCNLKCCGGGCGHRCTPAMIGKILLVAGGINWGLVGVGMLMSSDWNVLHVDLGTVPALEAIIYVLVGVAAIASIFGCRCKKCTETCASCGSENMN